MLRIHITGLIPLALAACSASNDTQNRRNSPNTSPPATAVGGASSAMDDAGPATTLGGSTGSGGSLGASGSMTVPTDGGVALDLDGSTSPGCVSQKAATGLRPLALVFVLDKSDSMDGGRWTGVTTALKGFFSDPASVNLASSLTFFPISVGSEPNKTAAALAQKCDTANYATPAVPLTPLPSSLFGTAIDAATLAWYTPTLPAVQAAISYARGIMQVSNSMAAVVLATDGEPTPADCGGNNTTAGVAAAVADAAAEIPTFVIGVGQVSSLNQIAAAGGTGQAFMVDDRDRLKVETGFAAAVRAIRASSVSCEVIVPPPPEGQTLDFGFINVQYTPVGAAPVALFYDQSCTAENAWRFDNPVAPGYVELCPSTCASVTNSAAAEIAVEFGCAVRRVY